MISVIMPCYNVETEIEKSINSLFEQYYRDFEIIAIDDGSSDHTYDLLMKMARQDNRLKAFTQVNAGPSAARNRGLELASGDYIMFCDSDDMLDKEFLGDLIGTEDEPQWDISIGGLTYLYPSGQQNEVKGINFLCDRQEYLDKYYVEHIERRLIFGPVNKVYRRDIIEKYNVRFDTSLKIREDGIFVFKYLKYCHMFKGIERAGYYYIQHGNNDSLITKYNSGELEINKRFYEMMKLMKSDMSEDEIKVINIMFLNMDLSTIRRYFLSTSPGIISGARYIASVYRDETYDKARRELKKIDRNSARKYYRPLLGQLFINYVLSKRKSK